ncbi:MAG: P-loop NTPase [Firmicutes bacterium]|nr:P-loop NTPase [Bacillota bacterium]
MKLAVASGKGGTGKTTIAVNLARVLAEEGPVQFIDCDVEEPNAHFFLKPSLDTEREVSILVPVIDRVLCNGCGECVKACAFNAIAVLGHKALVFAEICHGCGGCARVCPTKAITEQPNRLGVVSTGPAGNIFFVEGRIDVGTPLSVPVTKGARREIKEQDGIVILDAPPGTTCPVVAAVAGCDYVLLVTEPTPFGLNDLKLAVELVRELDIPHGVVINRADIGDQGVEEFCRREGISIHLRIPFERQFAETIAHGGLLVDAFPAWRPKFQALWHKIQEEVTV